MSRTNTQSQGQGRGQLFEDMDEDEEKSFWGPRSTNDFTFTMLRLHHIRLASALFTSFRLSKFQFRLWPTCTTPGN